MSDGGSDSNSTSRSSHLRSSKIGNVSRIKGWLPGQAIPDPDLEQHLELEQELAVEVAAMHEHEEPSEQAEKPLEKQYDDGAFHSKMNEWARRLEQKRHANYTEKCE